MPVDQRLVSKLSVYLIHGLFLTKSSFTFSQITDLFCGAYKKKKKKISNLSCGGRDSDVQTHFPKFSVLGKSWRRVRVCLRKGVTVSTALGMALGEKVRPVLSLLGLCDLD